MFGDFYSQLTNTMCFTQVTFELSLVHFNGVSLGPRHLRPAVALPQCSEVDSLSLSRSFREVRVHLQWQM